MTQEHIPSDRAEIALLALGSNATSQAGTPRETVEAAIRALDSADVVLRARSRLFLTPFVPKGQGADVVNAVVTVETKLEPRALLDLLHGIEAAFDRNRGERWRDRTLDLDILAMGDRVLPDRETVETWMQLDPESQRRLAPEGLTLPHPRMHERAFVLVPAADVAPEWMHPLTGQTIAQMRDRLPVEDVAAVRALEN